MCGREFGFQAFPRFTRRSEEVALHALTAHVAQLVELRVRRHADRGDFDVVVDERPHDRFDECFAPRFVERGHE